MAEPKKAISSARQTLKKYADLTKTGDEDSFTQMASLIADLMHLADKEKWDFGAILNSAENYYWADKEASR